MEYQSPIHFLGEGFGLSQLLGIALHTLTVSLGSTIAIEEPEIHLHPSPTPCSPTRFIEALVKKLVEGWTAISLQHP